MTKSTMGTKLPRKLISKMQIVGEQIKLARLRRNLSIARCLFGTYGLTGGKGVAYCFYWYLFESTLCFAAGW